MPARHSEKKKQFDESNLTWGPLSNQNYVVHHCFHNGQFYPKASSDSVGKKAISWEQMKKDFLKNMGQFLKLFSGKHMWGFIWDGRKYLNVKNSSWRNNEERYFIMANATSCKHFIIYSGNVKIFFLPSKNMIQSLSFSFDVIMLFKYIY